MASKFSESEIHQIVSERYGATAETRDPQRSDDKAAAASAQVSLALGYSDTDLKEIPQDSNMGLGCGNPTAIAALKEGEVVVDLGCGGGLDVFLASKKVGESGKVIGVDMTEKMINLARRNAEKGGYTNVSFVLSPIENISSHIDHGSVDVIISNCVLNLVPNKAHAFAEIYKVLKPNAGRIVASDIVLKKQLPEIAKNSPLAYASCVGGAVLLDEYERLLENAGFKNIRLVDNKSDLNVWNNSDLAANLSCGTSSGSVGGSCCGGAALAKPAKEDSGSCASSESEILELLKTVNFNEYVASYSIFATRGD